MNPFGRHKEQPGIPAAEVQGLQRNSDPRTEAEAFIRKQREEAKLSMQHPWEADNLTLLRMGFAANAQANDALAEQLIEKGTIAAGRHSDVPRLLPDVATIATELSRHSAQQMRVKVRGLKGMDVPVDFDDNYWRYEINPDNQTPMFPAVRPGTADEEPTPLEDAWQDPSLPPVSPAFVVALIAAGRYLQCEAFDGLQYATQESQCGFSLPAEHADAPARLDALLTNSIATLDEAEDSLLSHTGEVPRLALAEIYSAAYSGYIDSATALVMSVVPLSDFGSREE